MKGMAMKARMPKVATEVVKGKAMKARKAKAATAVASAGPGWP